MFQVNDTIIYGIQGVCKIVGIEEKAISGTRKDYFVLKPLSNEGSTLFAPTDNEAVLRKMRRVLSKNEIDALIDSMPHKQENWIEDERKRREVYKQIISSGDHAELIKMIKAIYLQKQEREAAGRRLHMADEQLFKQAEQILHEEFQYGLSLNTKDELITYISGRIGE